MTIYNIVSDVRALNSLMEGAMTDPETGEVRELTDEENADFLEWLKETEGNLETKFDNICKVIKNLQAQAEVAKAEKDALNAEIDRLRKREQARLNEAARVKGLVSYALKSLGMKKYKTNLFSSYFTASKKCARPVAGYFNPDNIPAEYLKRELSPGAVDKAVKEGSLYEKEGPENTGKLFYNYGEGERELTGVSYLGSESLVVR